MKPDRLGSLLVQEKYQEEMSVTETTISYDDDDDDNNNNNKRNCKCNHTQVLSSKERNRVC